jgi:hypothetical protein
VEGGRRNRNPAFFSSIPDTGDPQGGAESQGNTGAVAVFAGMTTDRRLEKNIPADAPAAETVLDMRSSDNE